MEASKTDDPVQTGLLEVALTEGLVFTCMIRVAVAAQPPAVVTVMVYVPALPIEAANDAGFCAVEVNPAGPDQLYVYGAVPPVAEEVSTILAPTHTGLLPVVLTAGARLVVET